ncbi:MAG: sulfate adenylyltransferase subunit 1 [Candidatus Sericytochromatia bacterium]
MSERLQVVVAGHVDHGKSTLIGRLLADSGSLPEGKLEQLQAYCTQHARRFEYAFLLDALKAERAQGITLDVARIFLRTATREYLLLDAPGHSAFLKNMITGASRADAALMVLDAEAGLQESSYRHGHLLSMLGVRQLALLVNKMDRVDYSAARFDDMVADYTAFLAPLGLVPQVSVPVSGVEGVNITGTAAHTPWYSGPALLEVLEQFQGQPSLEALPLRLPIQDVYKFTRQADAPRVLAGQLESGHLQVGDPIRLWPSGQRSHVKALVGFPTHPAALAAGQAASVVLADDLYLKRGEVVVHAEAAAPLCSRRLRVHLFWLSDAPLQPRRDYVLRLGTAKVTARLAQVDKLMTLEQLELTQGLAHQVGRNEIAECVLALDQPLACESLHDHPTLSRFVLIDGETISGGGVVLSDASAPPLTTGVSPAERALRFGHQAAQITVHGTSDRLKALESSLFRAGYAVFLLEPPALQSAAETEAQAQALVAAGLLVLRPAPEASAAYQINSQSLHDVQTALAALLAPSLP